MTKGLGYAIAGVQLFDIVIHAATDQLELLRIGSNIVILVWLGWLLFGNTLARSKSAGYSAVSIYIVLNIVFLMIFGATNPEQGDALRTMLFLLIALTTGGSVWLIQSRIDSSI